MIDQTYAQLQTLAGRQAGVRALNTSFSRAGAGDANVREWSLDSARSPSRSTGSRTAAGLALLQACTLRRHQRPPGGRDRVPVVVAQPQTVGY